MFSVETVLNRMKNMYKPRTASPSDKIKPEDISLTRVDEENGNYHNEVSIKKSSENYNK